MPLLQVMAISIEKSKSEESIFHETKNYIRLTDEGIHDQIFFTFLSQKVHILKFEEQSATFPNLILYSLKSYIFVSFVKHAL